MGSFENINYNTRPNKAIERKMINEALSRLSFIRELQEYRYIGMGATYFTDFNLFHKSLGIKNMVSIEQEESKRARFELNRPFSCINMAYGSSTNILPNLELEKHNNIIWLDYDYGLEDFIFSDLDIIVANSKVGSTFLISLNVLPQNKGTKEEKLQNIIDKIGRQRIPNKFLELNLGAKNIYIELIYELINRQINKSLLERNGDKQDKVYYKQIFNYFYQDGAPMLTIGGILHDNEMRTKINRMNLENLKHLSFNSQQYKIQCPNLTYREVQILNNLLPKELDISITGNIKNPELKKLPLNHGDIINYSEIYRYYPNYAETNI